MKHNDRFSNGVYCFDSPFDDFENTGQICFISKSTDLIDSEKPAYLSIFMDRKQLETIIQNKHLFDTNFMNAVFLVANAYDNLQVHYEK